MYPETRSRYISLRKNDAREAQKVFFPFMWDLTGSNCDNFLNSSAASSDAMNSYVFLLEAIDQLVADKIAPLHAGPSRGFGHTAARHSSTRLHDGFEYVSEG